MGTSQPQSTPLTFPRCDVHSASSRPSSPHGSSKPAHPPVSPASSHTTPPLTSEQVSEIENKIGAGLIEEVIQVAEGELKLVDVLAKSKVWEDLEEKPVEGQWEYFKRSGVLQNP